LSNKQNKVASSGGVNENDWRMLHRIYNIVTYYNLAACY